MSESETLRLGVLVDSEFVQRWQRDALAAVVETMDARITTVVCNERDTDADADRSVVSAVGDTVDRIRTYPLWSLLGVARLLTDDPAHERAVHIESIPTVASAERLACPPETVDEYWNTLPAGAVAALSETDVVVRFGFGMIKGDVLDAPTYGVLSYHMGDIREYRGQPGGFWEFLDDEPEMGVTVQRLTDTLDGGEIAAIERFDIGDARTYQEVWRRAHRRATVLLVPAVEAVTRRDVTTPDELGTLYSMPEGLDVLRYAYKNTRGRLRDRLDHTTGWGSPAVTAALLVTGAVLTGGRPLLTDHSPAEVHPEQCLGALVLAAGLVHTAATALPLAAG